MTSKNSWRHEERSSKKFFEDILSKRSAPGRLRGKNFSKGYFQSSFFQRSTFRLTAWSQSKGKTSLRTFLPFDQQGIPYSTCRTFHKTLQECWTVSFNRRCHTSKLAVYTVVGMWTFVNTVSLPVYVMDALYYRIPLEKGCVFNREMLGPWNKTRNMMVFNFSFCFIILAYPFIWWKWRRSGRIAVARKTVLHRTKMGSE